MGSKPQIAIGMRAPLQIMPGNQTILHGPGPDNESLIKEDSETPPHVRDRKRRVPKEVMDSYSAELQESIKEKRVLWSEQSLALDDPFVNIFLEIEDLKTFKKFIQRYGIEMLIEEDAFAKALEKRETAQLVLMFTGNQISEDGAGDLWGAFKKPIAVLQVEIREFMGELAGGKDSNQAWEAKRIAPLARNVKNRFGESVSVQHYKTIREASLYMIHRKCEDIKECSRPDCHNLYLRRDDKHLYCGTRCKYLVRRTEAAKNNLHREKAVLTSRVNRNPDFEDEHKRELSEAIRKARSKTALRKIEKNHGLEPRKSGPKAAKKGEARHGGTC